VDLPTVCFPKSFPSLAGSKSSKYGTVFWELIVWLFVVSRRFILAGMVA